MILSSKFVSNKLVFYIIFPNFIDVCIDTMYVVTNGSFAARFGLPDEHKPHCLEISPIKRANINFSLKNSNSLSLCCLMSAGRNKESRTDRIWAGSFE